MQASQARGRPDPELVLLPSLNAQRGASGGLVLTRKFLSGVAEYAAYWPGRVTALVRIDEHPTSDMDRVEVQPVQETFAIEVRPPDPTTLRARLRDSSVVLAFLSREEGPTVHLCRELGVPLVYSSEYSAKTECEIVDTQTRNPVLRWRRKLWIRAVERARIEALGHAAGIQCSGTPTYEVYGKVHANALLFFDNRVRRADVINVEAMDFKCRTIEQGRPLRLAFGGRLIAMKGVADLPLVARALAARGVPFTLDIYGHGDLEPHLRKRVRQFGLDDHVRFRGVLDFQQEWIPTLKRDVDLFICCHPQGDPSSTYPEVMSCGVPIAGYDNDAFKGIVQHSEGGWLAPTGQPEALAMVVARLHEQRANLVAVAWRARDFAAAHAFESTFASRARHVIDASRHRDTTGLHD
jgi:colanic acid/amylovoran biosynthesis glycosyltransferase